MRNGAKIAIVGCGLMTKSVHLPAALRSPKMDVVALVDSHTENARELTRQFALKCKVSDDLNNVIDMVDGVIIVTPNHTHYPIAKIALEKSIPVLIEKPITTTYSDAVALCELADKNNTFISVGYRTRFFPSVILFKKLLEKGYFGKLNHFHYEFGSKGGWAPVSGYNMDRKKSGGGVLVISGTHFIDRMLYWFGEPGEVTFSDDSYGGVEANCKAEMVFENNYGKFTGSFAMSKTAKLSNKFTFDSEKFRCEIGESESEKIIAFPKDGSDIRMELYPNGSGQKQEPIDSFKMQIEEFADNIIKKEKITIDGWFAARSIKLIEEMYAKRTQLEEPWATCRNEELKNHV